MSAVGALRFGDPADVAADNTCLADEAAEPDIAALWDDFDPGSGGATFAWHDAEADRFIVSWDGVRRGSGSGAASFQVHLIEGGEVELHFEDLTIGGGHSYGGDATVGFQDAAGGTQSLGNSLLVSCNDDDVISESLGLVFSSCVDGDGDGERDEACGGLDCDDGDPARFPGNDELCDGVDNNCDGVVPSDEVDGDGDGWPLCDDCADDDASTHPEALEQCNGVDDDCDGAVGSEQGTPEAQDSNWAGARLRGTKWRIDESIELSRLSVLLNGSQSQTLTFLVYESETEEGPFERIAGVLDTVETSDLGWHESPPLGLRLEGGRYYVTAVSWLSSAGYFWATPEDLPMATPHGAMLGGVALDSVWSPPASLGGTPNEVLYSFRHTFSDEVDEDGDGSLRCDDCDDDDPDRAPHFAEVCDGIDNDCDPGTDEVADADADGSSLCDGDCDDADPGRHPDATEQCDGVDHDCDGLVDLDDPDCEPGSDDDDAVDDDDSGSGDDDDTTALQDDGCQWECDGAGVRFGARAIGQGATSLSCLFVLAAVRRRRPERTECSS